MSIDTRKLRDALTDPLVMAMDDAVAAAQPGWSAPVVSYRPIPLAGLEQYLLTNSLLAPLEQLAADQAADATLRGGLTDFLALLASPRLENLGYDDPTIRGRANAILGAIIPLNRGLTAEHAAAIAAMGTVNTYTFGGAVTVEDVTAARAAIVASDGYAARQRFLDAHYNTALDWLRAQQAAGVPVPSEADVVAKVGAP